jgi:hypothetical protein
VVPGHLARDLELPGQLRGHHVRPGLPAVPDRGVLQHDQHDPWRYFSAPGSTTSLENQVEWVLERPYVSGAQAQLPNFGEIYFDSAVGGQGLENVVQAGQDTVINMTENGNTVATTTVETPTLIKIAYTGP